MFAIFANVDLNLLYYMWKILFKIRRAPPSSSVWDFLPTFILIIIHQHPNPHYHHPCHQHPSCQHSQSSIATSIRTPSASTLQAAKPPSKLPASMIPGLQARCIESSSHVVMEFWRVQNCKFLTSNHRNLQVPRSKASNGATTPVKSRPTGCDRLPNFLPQNTPKSMKSTQIRLKFMKSIENQARDSRSPRNLWNPYKCT